MLEFEIKNYYNCYLIDYYISKGSSYFCIDLLIVDLFKFEGPF